MQTRTCQIAEKTEEQASIQTIKQLYNQSSIENKMVQKQYHGTLQFICIQDYCAHKTAQLVCSPIMNFPFPCHFQFTTRTDDATFEPLHRVVGEFPEAFDVRIIKNT